LLRKPGERRPPSVQYTAIWSYCGHASSFEIKPGEKPHKTAARKQKAELMSCRVCQEKENARVRAEARLRRQAEAEKLERG
jgi:hypothetical protein